MVASGPRVPGRPGQTARTALGLHYAIEALYFRARDWLSAPENKLGEVGLQPGWVVLDFGCGVGSYALAAARLVGTAGRVYAVDVVPARVAQVRDLAARHGLSNLQGIVSDCDTGVESGTVDAVLLYDVLHAVTETEPVLAELARVLKPTGLLSCSDHHLSEAQMRAYVTAEGKFRQTGRGRRTHTFAREESSV